jgi:hypothetical protein
MNYFTKCTVFGLFSLLTSVSVSAQIERIDSLSNWKKAFRAGLNLNQASFSSNWKAGGVNSIGFNTFLNYRANLKKGLHSWDNEIDLLYGMINNQGQGQRKTLDRVYLDTKYGRALNKNWDAFLAFNFLSQFAKGYKYELDDLGVEQRILISDAFAPAFITASIGFEYHPTEYFKLRLSPFAPRLTVLRDNDGRYAAVDSVAPYGVVVGENTRFEWLAFQALAEFNKDIAKNLNLKWRYMMFANYETLELKTIDHRLDINITAKVNQFVNVSLGGILLYDFDQDPGAQSSQAFSLGLLYSIRNFKEEKK